MKAPKRLFNTPSLVPGQSLEIYSKLSLDKAQEAYDENIKDFPV